MHGSTEDGAAAPAWVETEYDRIAAGLAGAAGDALRAARGAYLDCLAGVGGPADPLLGQQRCHAALLQRLAGLGLPPDEIARAHLALERLEADIADRT